MDSIIVHRYCVLPKQNRTNIAFRSLEVDRNLPGTYRKRMSYNIVKELRDVGTSIDISDDENQELVTRTQWTEKPYKPKRRSKKAEISTVGLPPIGLKFSRIPISLFKDPRRLLKAVNHNRSRSELASSHNESVSLQ